MAKKRPRPARVKMGVPSDGQELSCSWELGTSEGYCQCDEYCAWRTDLALLTAVFSYLKNFTNTGLFQEIHIGNCSCFAHLPAEIQGWIFPELTGHVSDLRFESLKVRKF